MAARKRRRPAGDAGTSLVEILVTMAIMSTVGIVFTGAILQSYGATTNVDTRAQAQTQVRLAFQRLDREIRYAYGVTAPATIAEAAANAGTWNVEFLRLDSQTGAPECSQLRLKGGKLFLRRWSPATPPSGTQTGTVLASDIDMTVFATPAAPGAPVPFELQAAGSTPFAGAPAGTLFSPEYQRLRLRLVTVVGAQRMSSDVTFTALNTTRTAQSTGGYEADVCRQQGRP